MQDWYEDSGAESSYYEFDPWFDATDSFTKEKEKIEIMKNKELFDYWTRKQQKNA